MRRQKRTTTSCKNLGKDIELKIFFKIALFILSVNILDAKVTAKADYQKVELGEMVTYSLEISGEDIVRPNIKKLCGTDVISTGSQTNMQIINGAISRSYVLSYKFVPQKSCNIEAVEVEIDGQIEKSNEVGIEVVPASGAKDGNFVLELRSDKKELFVGESFEVTLLFRQKSTAEAVDSEFTPPVFDGFWVKEESKPQREQENGYIVTKITYKLAPQRAGELDITKAMMRIASRGGRQSSWGDWIPSIRWKSYFSNELSLHVKPLPQGITLVGDFSIEVEAQKTEIDANEAVNITLHVKGRGNLEDIKSFKPDIASVAVYGEKIEIKGDELTQKLAFVSDKSFTIPPFTLKYFDPEAKEIKSISTTPLHVKVRGGTVDKELNIKKETKSGTEVVQETSESNMFVVLGAFIAGIILGVFAMTQKSKMSNKKREHKNIKDPKVLLVKLLPYKDDAEVKRIIEALEKSIYTGGDLPDKKSIASVLKRYALS